MDEEFAGQHRTITSVTTRTATVNPTIRSNVSYISTVPGLLKALQLISNLVGFLCIVTTVYDTTSSGSWFKTIAMTGFTITAILLSFYLFHVVEKLQQIPWIKIEFVYCLTLMVSNLISSAFITTLSVYSASFGAAAFFGFTAMVAYGVDAWLKYLGVKRGDVAQG